MLALLEPNDGPDLLGLHGPDASDSPRVRVQELVDLGWMRTHV